MSSQLFGALDRSNPSKLSASRSLMFESMINFMSLFGGQNSCIGKNEDWIALEGDSIIGCCIGKNEDL
jgi:hypothetical protein